MATGKEIRSKIKNLESTRKITKAMEMISVSKMRKAQDRMQAARPYSDKVRSIATHLGQANPEYVHPFMKTNEEASRSGLIVVSTDKGLCGGLNASIFRAVVQRIRACQAEGLAMDAVAIGHKGFGFLKRTGVPIVAHVTHLGDRPQLDKLIGPVKVLLDAYARGELRAIHLFYTRFVNRMKQEVVGERLLPLSSTEMREQVQATHIAKGTSHQAWDYLYEPDAKTVIDDLLVRYVEALVYQAVAENMASEQAARMVAMKAATDNAGHLIDDLKLMYNKTRQAAITKELSEIVSGAAAIAV